MFFRRLRRRLRAIFGGGTLDRQMDQELQFHLDLEAQRLEQQGLSPEEARTQAHRVFGGVERVREEVRDARHTSWVDTLVRNTRYARRALTRHPGYTIAVVATLGLGIGANTAIFSVIDGVLLKPLPYPGSDRLVLVRQSSPVTREDEVLVSIRELYDYREQLTDLEGLVEFHQMTFDLIKRGDPNRVNVGVVSSNFFEALRVKPILGRSFQASDERHGAEAVLLLSNAYWKTRFGGDPHIVGQVFQMNDRPHTVVGVLPPVPLYPQECDVYMPSNACPFRARGEERMAGNRRAFANLRVFGRLKPGVTLAHASAQVATVAERFGREHPESYRDARGAFTASALGLLGELTRNAKPLLLVLLGATGLVLLLAAANVASLTVARTLNRERELALRTALGAGRWQLVGQLLTESVLLGLGGGVVGLAVAWTTLGALSGFVARFTARTGDIAIDGRVLVFTAVVSILTGLAFGTLPALVARPGPASALRQSGASSGGPRQPRLLRALVVAQVAVSVMLLACAGLFLTSVYRLSRVDAGYRAERVLSAEVFGNFTRYATAEACLRLYKPLIEQLQQVPGVQSVSVGTVVPLGHGGQPFLSPFLIQGRQAGAERPVADVNIVSPRYFDTLGIPTIGGRGFLATDSHDSAPVVVISQAMARYWDGRDPVGSRVSFDNGEHWYDVVGIVGDVRQYGLDHNGGPQAYLPLDQATNAFGAGVLVRTSVEPLAMAQVVRDSVRAIDPDLPVEHIETLEDLRSGFLATPRLTASLLALFAGLALVVTLAGLVGVIGTSVSQRTQEFGIRMALGARPGGILAGVLRQGLTMVLVGLVVGIVTATFAARLLATYLFDTQPTDPLTFAAVAASFLLVGAIACLGPARRATRVDPMLALRSE